MAGRYLALAGGAPDHHDAVAARARPLGLRILRRWPDLLVLADPALRVLDLGETGLILGEVVARGGSGPLDALAPHAREAIRTSRGGDLLDGFWGGYVALIRRGAAALDIIRAPLGELPTFHASAGPVTAVTSDVMLFAALGLATPRVDWTALARHMVAGEIRRRDTCLAGIEELRGGERLGLIGTTRSVDVLWTPWPFASPERRFGDAAEAARSIRAQARHCVAARAPAATSSLLLLSGGLDSSIVAACLAESGRDFTCLTVVDDHPIGDERDQARLVAARVGRPLIERFRGLANVDLTRSAAAHGPRPVARSFEQDSHAVTRGAAAETGAALVVDGGGGDNVFCSLQSVAPVADCLLMRDPHARFWSMARRIGELADTSSWTVARRAWDRARRPLRGYRWPADHRLLSPAAIERSAGFDDHPWLHAPPDALPGRAAHIAMLVAAQGLIEDGPIMDDPPSRSLLVAQPLIETCVRTPSWFWFDRGCNRAAARHAFAAELPDAIVWRRSKGTPDGFVAELFEAHRGALRALLLDGRLAEEGLIDRAAVAALVDDPRPTFGHDYVRVMQLADAEAWARNW